MQKRYGRIENMGIEPTSLTNLSIVNTEGTTKNAEPKIKQLTSVAPQKTEEGGLVELQLEDDTQQAVVQKTSSSKSKQKEDKEEARDPKTARFYYDMPYSDGKGHFGIQRTYLWDDGHKEVYWQEADGSWRNMRDAIELPDVDLSTVKTAKFRGKYSTKKNEEEKEETRDPKTARFYYDMPYSDGKGHFGMQRTYLWDDGHKEVYWQEADGSWRNIKDAIELSDVEIEYIGDEEENQ